MSPPLALSFTAVVASRFRAPRLLAPAPRPVALPTCLGIPQTRHFSDPRFAHRHIPTARALVRHPRPFLAPAAEAPEPTKCP
jgi:hypothetical protein